MFRFFKHIRQTLALEGKVWRYVGYAFGEIFLIVLGIMIALEANEWKEDRRDRAEERDYIHRLIEELEKDIPHLALNTRIAERQLNFTKLLMDASQDIEVARERGTAFVVALMHAGYMGSVTITTDTFDELGSTGNLGLLDTDLRTHLLYFHRNHRNARKFDHHNDLVSVKFFELSSGVLTLEQSRWVLDQGYVGRRQGDGPMDLKPMDLNPAWVDDIHGRLSENQELLHWLPVLQRTRERMLNGNNNHEENANELLAALRKAQEELEN